MSFRLPIYPLRETEESTVRPAEGLRKERIFLTGFMGSGKSTIGPILANTLGWNFVDLDRAIERSIGSTINEIFREKGEAAFRVLEGTMLQDLAIARSTVIALGGGTLGSDHAFRMVSHSGILVYLRIPSEQLFFRLRKKTDRPLLIAGETTEADENQLRMRMTELHKIREPYYNMADIIVETGTQSVGRTVDELVRKLIPMIS